MKSKILLGLGVALLLVGMSGISSASLTTIGTANYNGSNYKLIYDSGMNITWLDYTNAKDYWQDQVDWAAGLNNSEILTINLNSGVEMNWTGDWRLPSTVDGPWQYGYDGTTTGGYNITTSEMGHLYYEELSNAGLRDTSGVRHWPLSYNAGEFENLSFTVNEAMYWSGTAYSGSTDDAWSFRFDKGFQGRNSGTGSEYRGIAVINSSPVPIPGALWLLGSGLLGLIGIRRGKKIS